MNFELLAKILLAENSNLSLSEIFSSVISYFQCNCDADSDCEVAKEKIEACRDSVTYATRNDTIVSCTEARWICLADAECGKALEYYHLFCRSMFRGKGCSERCKNR